ncbi:MAG: DNA polymerase III subunit gamma/tau [Hyphomicrobiaceae bacterium]
MAKRKSSSEAAKSGEAGASPGPVAGEPTPYLVLARKYRPQTFEDLIGQEAMVTTIRNAFRTGRIAQAFMLTGVRGVGKTTTARIMARAFNYERPGIDSPSVDMPEPGTHCQAIMESRHPDVLEMDAASNTGVDNIREMIESVRYKPLAARMKVYIIDEVHMLSKGAFNALLKTLEEPPPHVKFIFATTEIRKVPVTVLSRCQRFDLRRVEASQLIAHFERIAAAEGFEVEEEALRLIARAAEGSVRDGLSILDQAFASTEGKVEDQAVRDMLGLADRGRIFDLLELVLGGKTKEALQQVDGLIADGADPLELAGDLAECVNAVTRVRVGGAEAASEGLSNEERKRSADLAGRLGVALLSRAWQMLLAGHEEIARAAQAGMALEMLVVRMCHMASLPGPDEVIRRLGAQRGSAARPAESPPQREAEASFETEDMLASDEGAPDVASPDDYGAADAEFLDLESVPTHEDEMPLAPISDRPTTVPSAPKFQSFQELVDFVGSKRDALLKIELEERVRLVRFEPPKIEIALVEGASPNLVGDLSQKLQRWTGERWMVAVSREQGERPLGEVRREAIEAEIERVKKTAMLQATLAAFPDAEIVDVRPISQNDDESAAG